RSRGGAGDARGRDGQNVFHRGGAARDRPRGADLRRPGGEKGNESRTALPRDPRATHLRGSDRSAKSRDRPRDAEESHMTPPANTPYTAHLDAFVRDHLPAPEDRPD